MKKLIRAILKIPATFVFIPFCALLILMSYAVSATYWVYETNEWDIRANRDVRNDLFKDIKEWFTTI